MLPWILQKLKSNNKTAILWTVVFVAVLFLFFASTGALFAAQGDTFGVNDVGQNIALGSDDIRIIIGRIIRAVLGLLGIIAVVIVLYAGFTIMTAGGDEEKITIGKKTLINAVIGLAIIMSAFAIVQFVLTKLMQATGLGFGIEGGGSGNAPTEQTFTGSGSLGRVVRDHYPFVGQQNVARNTKISVIFAEAMNPETIIANTNQTCWPASGAGSPVSMANPANCLKNDRGQIVQFFGDCVTPPAGTAINPQVHCDNLLTDNVQIVRSASSSVRVAATALTSYTSSGEANTFVFKPFDGLGDNIQNVGYKVLLTNNIKKTNGEGAFVRQRTPYYEWGFETGTEFDFSPPHVASTLPASTNPLQSIPRNNIIQINFDEAMDPTSIQGSLSPTSSFTNLIFNQANVRGEWRVSNAYATTEFIPAQSCGQNSCGEEMFCLPANNNYETLVRTAQLDGTGTFQALPFTGVTDMAGNALDGGNPAGSVVPNGQPLNNGDKHVINSAVDKAFDNYYWDYIVRDVIDLSVPLVEQVTPTVDKQGVGSNDPLQVYFSKAMLGYTLGDMGLEEYREGGTNIEQPWYRTRFVLDRNNKTVTTIDHRAFGPNATDYYYFAGLPSTVKSINQNCLYPGKGPNGDAVCSLDEPANCVPVTNLSTKDTGCAALLSTIDRTTQPDVATCLTILRSESRNLVK